MRAALTTVWKPGPATSGVRTYTLGHSYVELFQSGGIEPFAILPGASLEGFDLLVLTGGGDPDPSLFGREDRGSRNPERERPLWEMELYRAARSRGVPVLGICLGMQLMAITEGVPLVQDLDAEGLEHIPHESADGKPVPHSVELVEGSGLKGVLGSSLQVSSCHHQVIECVPRGFRLAGRSADGLIEAIESAEGTAVGVQWHPERDGTGEGVIRLMKEIVERKV